MNILITGGTGSFGNAFVEKLLGTDQYNRICIYSRDEVKQTEMRTKFNDDDRLRWFIGDIRDKDRLTRAFNGIDTVVHAAALKRIEVGRYNPSEMVKTNVVGAMNVIDAAQDAGVKKVVALSTDKAYQPISAYGQSKALMESLFLAANNQVRDGIKFSVTRYGNVSGSRGSVIPVWREILKESDTVPVTDPECTRFWMTIEEAVDLVVQTIEYMPRDIVIPNLPAYQVRDLASALDVRCIDIKGLPEWEKMHEGMADGNTSDIARRMSVEELKECLIHIK